MLHIYLHQHTGGRTNASHVNLADLSGCSTLPPIPLASVAFQHILHSFSIASSGLARFEVPDGISDFAALSILVAEFAKKRSCADPLGMRQEELTWHAGQEKNFAAHIQIPRVKQVQLVVPATIGQARPIMEQKRNTYL
jgi:hypothetical protein